MVLYLPEPNTSMETKLSTNTCWVALNFKPNKWKYVMRVITDLFLFPSPETHLLLQHRALLLEADYKWMSKDHRESRESKLRKKAYLIGMGIKQAAVHLEQTVNPRLYIRCGFGTIPRRASPHLPTTHTTAWWGCQPTATLGWAVCHEGEHM